MPIAVKSPDLTALARRLGNVAKDAPKAFAQATISVGRASKTETKRAAAAVYNLTQARIDKDLVVRQQKNTVSVIGLKKKRGPSLISYGATATGRGISVRVIKKNGRKLIKSGFLAKGLAGDSGDGAILAFIRDGSKRVMRAGRYQGKRRQPVRAMRGPSVADMILNAAVYTPLQAKLISRATDELNRRITRELANRG